MSKRTTSGSGRLFCTLSLKYFKASAPLIAQETSQKSERAPDMTSWFTSSSSTERTKGRDVFHCSFRLGLCDCWAKAWIASSGLLLVGTSLGTSATGTASGKPSEPSHEKDAVKVEPWPSCERTLNLPPCSSAISVQTARPRPMPWKDLASPFCSCWKGSKISFWPSSLMPLPVSVTSISNRCWPGKCRADKDTDPFSVNLQALVTKL
mmetsp:Transcript_58263/g.147742  ORF Transcript_58263/g.147742 Transcript_58263/m.147742 type:complete len:208 (+) Transcript_58263:1036-1659(+)